MSKLFMRGDVLDKRILEFSISTCIYLIPSLNRIKSDIEKINNKANSVNSLIEDVLNESN